MLCRGTWLGVLAVVFAAAGPVQGQTDPSRTAEEVIQNAQYWQTHPVKFPEPEPPAVEWNETVWLTWTTVALTPVLIVVVLFLTKLYIVARSRRDPWKLAARDPWVRAQLRNGATIPTEPAPAPNGTPGAA
jgi:hypothetical protein